MMKTGVCSVTFRKFDVAEVIKLTAAAGLDGIEWGSDVHVPPGDPEWAANVRRMTLDAGLQVLGCGSYFRCDNRDEIAPLVELARALGAPAIRIWTGRKSHTLFSNEERAELAAVMRATATDPTTLCLGLLRAAVLAELTGIYCAAGAGPSTFVCFFRLAVALHLHTVGLGCRRHKATSSTHTDAHTHKCLSRARAV
jgi:hypothetical protein